MNSDRKRLKFKIKHKIVALKCFFFTLKSFEFEADLRCEFSQIRKTSWKT